MSASIETARDEIHTIFLNAWLASADSQDVLVIYWDLPKDTPTGDGTNGDPDPWARISVMHTAGYQASLSGDSGKRRWRRLGVATVELYTPTGDGLSLSDKLTMVAMRAFEGKSTPSGIWFRDVQTEEVGPDGVWFHTNVKAYFEYDEVR